MKNILIISPYFYPEGGGLENYAFQVARNLCKRGYYISVICLTKGKGGIVSIEGIKIYRVKCNFVVSNTPVKLSFLSDILDLLKQEKFDIIHAHTPVPFAVDMAALASRIKKIPLIITYHANTLYKNKLLIDAVAAVYALVQYFTLSQASKIVSVVGSISKSLKKWENKVIFITPGVNLENFKATPYPLNNQSLLFIAPLSKSYPSKGLEVLLKSLNLVKKNYPNIKLTVVGGGELENNYKKISEKLSCQDNVIFAGKIAYQKMPQVFQNSNILIVPSLKSEGSPTVILEAMSSARPVIGTKIGGIPHLIKDKVSGLLVTPNNPELLSVRIIELLKNRELADKFGKNGRKLAERSYSWENIANKYEELYKNS